MTSQFEYSTISESQDLQQIKVILSQCFGRLPSDWQTYFNRLGSENFRVIRQAGKVIGTLAIYQMGQW